MIKLYIIKFLTVLVFFSFGSENIFSQSLPKLKIGTLQYGSVNWELNIIKSLKLDIESDLDVEIVKLASKNAAAVALQGNAVDLIVTDWFWVSRQRSMGRNFSFIPHSMAAGGLIVNKNSPITDIEDLKDKKIGIAGGQVDKSWLIFRAFYKKQFGKDLAKESQQIFGAPPLLNKKIEQGSFDAILTYWPYQARLLAKDFKKIINITDIIQNLGSPAGMPIIGWVFKDEWSEKNKKILENFVKVSNEAKRLMLESDEIWNTIKSDMKAENQATFLNLRDIYREGIPKDSFQDHNDGASNLFSKLADIGGEALVGNSKSLSPGTFWDK